jgi:hypothetical protein
MLGEIQRLGHAKGYAVGAADPSLHAERTYR